MNGCATADFLELRQGPKRIRKKVSILSPNVGEKVSQMYPYHPFRTQEYTDQQTSSTNG